MAVGGDDWRTRALAYKRELSEKVREVGLLRANLQANSELLVQIKAANTDPKVSQLLDMSREGFPYELQIKINSNAAPGFLSSTSRFSVEVKLVDKRDRTASVDPEKVTKIDIAFKLDLVYADVKPYQLVDKSNCFYTNDKDRTHPIFEHDALASERMLDSLGTCIWRNLRSNVRSHLHTHAPPRPFRFRVLCTCPDYAALGVYSKPFRIIAKPPKVVSAVSSDAVRKGSAGPGTGPSAGAENSHKKRARVDVSEQCK